MGAAWVVARFELRRRWPSLVSLAVLVGLIGGVVLAAAAGARRTDSAYRRFLGRYGSFDAGVVSGPAFDQPVVDLSAVSVLPQVASSERFWSPPALATTPGGRVLWNGETDLSVGAYSGRQAGPSAGALGAKLLKGVAPDPTRADQVIVGYRSPQDPDADVGDVIALRFVRPDVPASDLDSDTLPAKDLLPPYRVRVVGIAVSPGEFAGDTADLFGTPALRRTLDGKVTAYDGVAVRLRRGLADYPAFAGGVERIAQGANYFSLGGEQVAVERSTHLQSVALWLFAAVAAAAGLMIASQASTRQVLLASTEHDVLRAVGMSSTQRFGVAWLGTAAAAAGGAVVAVLVAIGLSVFAPLGLARLAEPDPGLSVDRLVVIGALAVLAIVAALAAIPAWISAKRAGRPQGVSGSSRDRYGSATAAAISAAGLPAPAVVGVRMALEPGRGRTSVPVRSAMVAGCLAVVAVVVAVGFGSSFHHLLGTPRLYGWNWDAEAFSQDPAPLARALTAQPGVTAFSSGTERSVSVSSLGPRHATRQTYGYGVEVAGGVQPTITSGRWPASPGEVALGARTLRDLGANRGDQVEVRVGNRSAHMRVVGTAVFAEGRDRLGLGDGVGLTLGGLHRLDPEASPLVALVRLEPGTTPRDLEAGLERSLGSGSGPYVQTSEEQPTLRNLRRGSALPLALAGVLLVAAAGAMAHAIVVSTRRRRRDIAILRTLGFLRAQARASVAWQAVTFAAVALIVGIPVGLAAARWAWKVFAQQIGVVPQPVIAVVPILALIPATLVASVLIAALPARSAARVRPAVVLRSE